MFLVYYNTNRARGRRGLIFPFCLFLQVDFMWSTPVIHFNNNKTTLLHMYISIHKDISEFYACVKRYHFQQSKIDIVGTYIYVAMVTFSNCIQVTVWERDILNITGKITLSFVYEIDNKYNKINGKIFF